MVSCREFKVELYKRNDIKSFIETWHYSKSINGLKSDYCFKLLYNEEIIGGMIYGGLAMVNQYKKYCNKESDIVELRRLCCIDDTPKNTESYFIGSTLRWLKKNSGIRLILSYADPNYGHEGTIYKASNFKFVGKTQATKVIKYKEKTYHDKCIRTKYKGELKPFAKKVKHALEIGEAYYVKQLPKNIYVYYLRGNDE